MFLHLIALAWLFVVVLMAAAEALSPQGSWLGALMTLLLYGLLPLALVLYLVATPMRRARQRARQAPGAEAGPAQPTPPPLAPMDSATPAPRDGQ